MLKQALVIATILILTGCSTSPAPNYWQGKYYMAGDSKCANHYGTDAYDRMICADKNGKRTGELRNPIPEWQAKAYYQKKNSSSSTSTINTNRVECYKGLGFNQEIRTFKGMICPLGWMPML
jgi:hypothetical protein